MNIDYNQILKRAMVRQANLERLSSIVSTLDTFLPDMLALEQQLNAFARAYKELDKEAIAILGADISNCIYYAKIRADQMRDVRDFVEKVSKFKES